MASSVNSLPYSLESGSVTEPEAMLMTSKTISVPYCTGVTNAQFFMWAPVGFNSGPFPCTAKPLT